MFKERNESNVQEIQSPKEKKIIIRYLPYFLQKIWSTVFLSLVTLTYHSSFTVFGADTEKNNIP